MKAFHFSRRWLFWRFLIVYWKYKIASLGIFAFPAIFVMTFIANLAYTTQDSVPELLRSRWIYIHTPLVILGYVAFFIAFSAAVLYLFQERELKLKRVFFNRLPSLEICDDLAYRSLAVGFPLMTLGILSGALWAQQVWGVQMDERSKDTPRICDLAHLSVAYSLPAHRRLARQEGCLSGDCRVCRGSCHVFHERAPRLSSLKRWNSH